MKMVKSGLFLLLLLIGLVPTLRAQDDQDVILEAKKIDKSQVPPEVMAAYRKQFPNANLKDIMKLPTSVYKKDWQIEEQNKPEPDDEYYTLNLTGTNMKLEALYDKHGNLIRANEIAKDVALPKSIASYIVTNYKGYSIKKDKVKRFIQPTQTSATWEVTIAEGKGSTRRLLFDKDGNFLKEQ
ncbi:hypothetical protein [Chitinophaga sp. Cy-1792]|uniref:hypothetical protein n=1 Tax=Chitinophaga sp. Cy-1792 TaxID=2608339 RepID=UPI00141EEBB5|nr:hypothetical protein [Chitinophaga sp. Cy-1792]NIG54936.1 hypothetical protein [Chitinophaga sp. Cy-1792]